MSDSKKTLITGSFDPPTIGHLRMIRVGCEAFEEVVVCIFRNSEKNYMFTEAVRKEMLEAMLDEAGLKNVTVDVSDGYVADYARDHGIGFVLRGIRDEKDATYEAEMAKYNHNRNPELETFIWAAFDDAAPVSSTLARKSLQNGDFDTPILPEAVRKLARRHLVMG